MKEIVIKRRVGRTAYRVRVHIEDEGHETMEEKLLRIILNQYEVNKP